MSKRRFYVASKVAHYEMWKRYRDNDGINIISSWIDRMKSEYLVVGEHRTPAEWRELSELCISEAAGCDVLVLYARDGDRLRGAFMEIGAALGAGKFVHVVAERYVELGEILLPHPKVREFATLTAAFGWEEDPVASTDVLSGMEEAARDLSLAILQEKEQRYDGAMRKAHVVIPRGPGLPGDEGQGPYLEVTVEDAPEQAIVDGVLAAQLFDGRRIWRGHVVKIIYGKVELAGNSIK